jgi:hypothetical protein
LRGWPTISVLVQGRPVTEAKGNWRGKNATSTHQLPVETVALAPGHSAAFNVVYVDRMMVQHPRCVPFHAELITPPGVHRPLKAPEPSGKFCGLGVTVSPVVPGQIDRYMIG